MLYNNRPERDSPEYRAWRFSIFKRDEFGCQKCLRKGVKLEAHHIKRYADFPELRFLQSNGITLCVDCHNEVTQKGEEVFEKEFQDIVSRKMMLDKKAKGKTKKEERQDLSKIWIKYRNSNPRLRF